MPEPTPVYLKNLPRDAVEDLDELWGTVQGSGSIMAHKHDGEYVQSEARVIRRPKKNGAKAGK